jgi:hypothetical protein
VSPRRPPDIVDPEPPPPPPPGAVPLEDDLPARPSDPGRHLPAELPDDGGELDVEIIDAARPLPPPHRNVHPWDVALLVGIIGDPISDGAGYR